MSKGRRRCIFQLKQSKFTSTFLFYLGSWWIGLSLTKLIMVVSPGLLFQMLSSSGNTFIDTPRNNIFSRHLSPVKLTNKINYHKSNSLSTKNYALHATSFPKEDQRYFHLNQLLGELTLPYQNNNDNNNNKPKTS